MADAESSGGPVNFGFKAVNEETFRRGPVFETNEPESPVKTEPVQPESGSESDSDKSTRNKTADRTLDRAEMDLHIKLGIVLGIEVLHTELDIPYDGPSDDTRRLEYLMNTYVMAYYDFNSYDDAVDFCIRLAKNIAAAVLAGTTLVPPIEGEDTTSASGESTEKDPPDHDSEDEDSENEADDEIGGDNDEADGDEAHDCETKTHDGIEEGASQTTTATTPQKN